MKNSFLWIIAKKEFFSYLNSAVAYVVIVPFLVLNSFLFLRTALVVGDANLRPMIELLPWFLMIVGPALSMRAFADERRKDTLELVYAHPISEWTIALSKYGGLLLFYGLMLAATLPLPITLAIFSTPDFGLIVGQYIGAVLVGAVFIAVGITASALVGGIVGGFLVGVAVNFLLLLSGMGFVTLMFPGFLGRLISEIAIISHIASISRGVIDFRDLLYFGTLIVLAMTLTVIKLSERKVVELPLERRKLWVVMALALLVAFVGNVLAYEFPIRFDMTNDHRYSLSRGTKQLLKELPDRVTITLYASNNLPGPMQATMRETTDWLKDFQRFGKKIVVKTVAADAASSDRAEALQQGIREVQFNQIGTSSFQVATGFLGLVVRYGAKTEVIDYVEDSSNLEYQLARMLLKLTSTKQQKIGLVADLTNNSSQVFTSFLEEQYDVAPLTQTSVANDLIGLMGIIVVDDGMSSHATSSALIQQYLTNGGNLAVFADGMSVDMRSFEPTKSVSELLPVLSTWGVTIKPDLVYDTQLNESVTLGAGTVRYILPYPFWIRSLVKKTPGSFVQRSSNVLLGWASSVESKTTDGLQITPLMTTGQKSGGTQESAFTINPQTLQQLAQPTGEKVVGVLAQKGSQRVVIIGDSDAATDEFMKNSAENQSFVTNLADWIAADPILSTISRRGSARTVFTFSSPSEVQLVQYANIAGPSLLMSAFGGWWLWRRKKLTRRIWHANE
jgi:ABC-2 type transport system permease protein